MFKRALLFGVWSGISMVVTGCSFPSGYDTVVGSIVDTASLINIIAGIFGQPPIIPNT